MAPPAPTVSDVDDRARDLELLHLLNDPAHLATANNAGRAYGLREFGRSLSLALQQDKSGAKPSVSSPVVSPCVSGERSADVSVCDDGGGLCEVEAQQAAPAAGGVGSGGLSGIRAPTRGASGGR